MALLRPLSLIMTLSSRPTSGEKHKLLGTKLLMLTLFHPQTDSASECAIQLVMQILCAMVKLNQQNWADKIPLVEFALNLAISNSLGFALFKLNYGYIPSVNPGFTLEPWSVPGVQHFVMCTL